MSHLKKPKTEHLNIILHLQQEKDTFHLSPKEIFLIRLNYVSEKAASPGQEFPAPVCYSNNHTKFLDIYYTLQKSHMWTGDHSTQPVDKIRKCVMFRSLLGDRMA